MPTESFDEGSLAECDALLDGATGRSRPRSSFALGEMLRLASLPSSSVPSTSILSRPPSTAADLLDAASEG